MKVIRSLLLLFVGLCFTLLADSQTAVPAKAVVAMNATWTDPATNLMWADMDNVKDVSWNQATAYCSELQLAGLSGWRLPTIEELQGIHSPSGAITKTSMDFGDAWVHVKGNLKLTGWHWSSSQGDAGSN